MLVSEQSDNFEKLTSEFTVDGPMTLGAMLDLGGIRPRMNSQMDWWIGFTVKYGWKARYDTSIEKYYSFQRYDPSTRKWVPVQVSTLEELFGPGDVHPVPGHQDGTTTKFWDPQNGPVGYLAVPPAPICPRVTGWVPREAQEERLDVDELPGYTCC